MDVYQDHEHLHLEIILTIRVKSRYLITIFFLEYSKCEINAYQTNSKSTANHIQLLKKTLTTNLISQNILSLQIK